MRAYKAAMSGGDHSYFIGQCMPIGFHLSPMAAIKPSTTDAEHCDTMRAVMAEADFFDVP
jgi:hypothetical protein